MIFRLFRKETEQERIADKLYAAIVAQARQPAFYQDLGVEDSVTGRFEMIVLHAYMLFHRLKDEPDEVKAIGQAVFDRFFADMDDSLREIGIGDLSVPKKIKKMGEAFYGRVEAYDTARAQGKDSLAQALWRNAYPDAAEQSPKAQRLADYVLASADILDAQSADALRKGEIGFAPILAPA